MPEATPSDSTTGRIYAAPAAAADGPPPYNGRWASAMRGPETIVHETRWQFLRPHVEARTVLDIGPAELVGTMNRHKMERWLHARIASVAKSVVGLERDADQVQALRALDFDIRQGDAETFALDQRFEVVFAGELVEHLSNPGSFLERAREHLVAGGRLVLTTPNRFSIQTFYRVLRTGKVPTYDKPIAKHVLYFDADALRSLLARHGFREIRIGYVRWVGEPSRRPLARLLNTFAARLRPPLSGTLVATAVRPSS